MIDINLIPAALRKDGGNTNALDINIPKEVLLGIGAGLLFLLVTVHLLLGTVWLAQTGRLAYYNEQWQKVLPDKTVLDGIHHESAGLKKEINMISDMTVRKSVLWAPKFNAISDSLTRGLWIKKMTLDKTDLTIEGSVVSRTKNEINNVGLFLLALRRNDGFMKGFSSLEVNSIQGAKDNSVDVTDFSAMAKLK